MAEDILPDIPRSQRLYPQSSSRERFAYPPSQPEPSNHPNISLKRYKAFKILLEDTSNTFDGRDSLKFLDWKEKLQREAEDLDLTAAQWIDLIRTRTTEEANEVIQPAFLLQRETSP